MDFLKKVCGCTDADLDKMGCFLKTKAGSLNGIKLV